MHMQVIQTKRHQENPVAMQKDTNAVDLRNRTYPSHLVYLLEIFNSFNFEVK